MESRKFRLLRFRVLKGAISQSAFYSSVWIKDQREREEDHDRRLLNNLSNYKDESVYLPSPAGLLHEKVSLLLSFCRTYIIGKAWREMQ